MYAEQGEELKNRLNFKRIEAYYFFVLLLSIISFSPFDQCKALEPSEVLVLANKKSAQSINLAKYYMNKRGIPEKNLLVLMVTENETCTRTDYEKKIAEPVREYLKQTDNPFSIRCIVIMYGLPLKISPSKPLKSARKSASLKKKLKTDNAKGVNDERASVDSEIALVLIKDYPLPGWQDNPYYIGFKNKKKSIEKKDVLMVSRIDGPSDKIAKRIIDDSLIAEAKGLHGTVYFDAKWPVTNSIKTSEYAFYDKSIHHAAQRIKKSGLFTVVINDRIELFKQDECPDAAIYCGWYSLAKYIDSFSWQTGAIGYHIASSECYTLKAEKSRVWCKMMLENGIAATLGPVSEPYLRAFPLPEIFFGFLFDGHLTLAECYLVSIPFFSWKMVLIGDPLYRPFKANAKKILSP